MGVILLLLDLSAAFDTVDHELLLETVERDVGLGGGRLDCMVVVHLKSLTSDETCIPDLSDRVQRVAVGDGRTTSRRLVCGVPQGSVLGHLLFTVYTSSLGKLLRSLALQFHLFADDAQLYLELVLSRDAWLTLSVLWRVESCVYEHG